MVTALAGENESHVLEVQVFGMLINYPISEILPSPQKIQYLLLKKRRK